MESDSIISFSSSVAEETAPLPLPKGRYIGTIRQVTVKNSQRNTRYAEVLFFIGPDQYPADYTDGNPDGLTIAYRRVSLEDNKVARWRLRMFCQSIGAAAPQRELNVSDWVSKVASIQVDHDEYEGTVRPNITGVSAA